MLVPYKDDNPTDTYPFVTIGIIVLNVLVFGWQVFSPEGLRAAVFSYGAVPSALMNFQSNQPIPPIATVLTSMFMHGGILHLGGNMLFLWIFGNNIEDKLGHVKFLLFYIVGGTIAAYSHAISAPASNVPMIGASGAVAAVLGAYIMLFPRAVVYNILFVGLIFRVRLPALIVIGFWAIIQFVNGIIEQGMMAGGGVAWFAHVGGFLFGMAVTELYLIRTKGYRRKKALWS